MLIGEAIEMFVDGYFSTCDRSSKTKAAYRTDLAQFEARFGAGSSLEAVDAESLEQWAKALVEAGYASVSIRRKFAAVRVFFGYWIRKGGLSASPLWRIRLDLAKERRLPKSLPASDVKRLIEQAWKSSYPADDGTAHPRIRAARNLALLEVLFATGIRVGELVSLNLKDWNEADSSFLIMGKGSRQRLAFLPDNRSLNAMLAYLECRKSRDADSDALFLNAGGHRLSAQGVARIVFQTATKAGIKTRLTPHMMRHTVATLLLREGADIRVVQELLGHSSIAITQRYTDVSKEHLRAMLRKHHPSHHLGIAFPLFSVVNQSRPMR